MSVVRRRNTIVEDIAEELRSQIVTGQLEPGQFLEPQKVLADRYGVGLSSVREAIQILAGTGLIESHPGKGTWVRPDALRTVFNPTEVKTRLGALNAQQVYEARSVIEVGLTAFAAERANADDIAHIWESLEAMRAAGYDDEGAFVKADLEFHLAIAKAGHSHLLEQFYYLVRELLSEVITELVMLPQVKDQSIIIQKAIAEAIEAHDIQRAQDAGRSHMQYIDDLLKTYS
jgi:GntR family transcriptional regulator, transcriptional repressor for pyruvate dehydrogenase complex